MRQPKESGHQKEGAIVATFASSALPCSARKRSVMSSAASSLSGDSVVNLTTPSFRHPGCFRTDCRARRRGPFPPTRRYRLSRERKCLVDPLVRSEERRGGNEGVRTGRY